MPCPHYDIKIVQRSKRQSAVAAAAYQSGDKLFSEYDQRQKSYSEKQGIVHTEILLPENAPPEYADRNRLWNAVEAVESQWNSQLARRFIIALPRELSREEQIRLMREYCQAQFVSKGMIADFAIHDKGDGNPHAHILLTLRPMDEQGHWLPKCRKEYVLDENGQRIKMKNGEWKSRRVNTVDWNDQKYGEIWRHEWEVIQNRYENVFLTEAEVAELQADFSTVWEEYVERLSEYMASTGKTYKSHAATIRRWAKEDRRKGKGVSDYSCKEGESL